MDVACSSICLTLFAPLMLIVSLLVKLTSSGPVFYKQRRCGLNGNEFTMLKFRTMRQDAEHRSGARWCSKHDDRITSIGKFLRRSHLDEFPQLLNVLKGEMSLVGPRPERPEFVSELDQTVPFYRERLLVSPGLTGWAQVSFAYADSVDATRRKLQYDLYYAKHLSFPLDCSILFSTIKTMFDDIRYSDDFCEPLPEQEVVERFTTRLESIPSTPENRIDGTEAERQTKTSPALDISLSRE